MFEVSNYLAVSRDCGKFVGDQIFVEQLLKILVDDVKMRIRDVCREKGLDTSAFQVGGKWVRAEGSEMVDLPPCFLVDDRHEVPNSQGADHF